MERYSMKEFTPLTFLEKKDKIDDAIEVLKEKRSPIVAEKKEIDEQIGEYNSMTKVLLPDYEYAAIMKAKTPLIARKRVLEGQIMTLNEEIRKKQRERDKVDLQRKKVPSSAIKDSLLELRDKYMSFAADTTRVSSMRAMSSKFVEEIQSILKYTE